jgi:hypothetical protein
MRSGWFWLPRTIALAIVPLLLASCAGRGELQSDMTRLRADLHTTTETLSQLVARIDELERRQGAMDSVVQQTQQELTQAVEVLLKKALVTENRLKMMQSEKKQAAEIAKVERQARQPSEPLNGVVQEKPSAPAMTPLSLGMTQEDVRRTLGNPISVENTGTYIFWQYAPQGNQKYVVFDKSTLQLWGWRGL